MKAAVKQIREKSEKMMREVYCRTLMEMAERDERIVALDADLVSSSGMKKFAEKYPDRFINCGIAEANMIGVAAGLSCVGKIPFAHTFGTFASRRVLDQVFMSGAYAKTNIRIIGSDPGVTAAYNGGTHMPFEDAACFMSIPGVTVIEPCDTVQLESIIRKLKDVYGIYYIRMQRKNPVDIFEEGSEFEIGKGVTLTEGKDVTVIASGIMVAEALKAYDMLKSEGISARIVNMFTWKPIDEELIIKCARETGAIVTAENHQCIGGLNSAVCSVICGNYPVPVEKVGIMDEFGEVGTEDFLRKRFNLTAEAIVSAAKRAAARKQK